MEKKHQPRDRQIFFITKISSWPIILKFRFLIIVDSFLAKKNVAKFIRTNMAYMTTDDNDLSLKNHEKKPKNSIFY